MNAKRYPVHLATFCLIVVLFMIITTQSSSGDTYDPWIDINDDGKINILDITFVAKAFGTSGTPINKTMLIQELETARAHNETYSTTPVSISGYSAIMNWQDMPDMTVKITLKVDSTLLIIFSAQAKISGTNQQMYVRALVDSTQANPPTGITLTQASGWSACSYTFYISNVAAGTHTIRMQWMLYDALGDGQMQGRTLAVMSLP